MPGVAIGTSRPCLGDAELLGQERGPIERPAGATGAPYDLVLVDRDGTLNVRRDGYVTDPDDLVLLPGAGAAVAAANRAGCCVVLVTNQRGLATGALRADQLRAVHRRLIAELGRYDAHLDGIQVCPHAAGTCRCRKPRGGLVREALRRASWAAWSRTVLLGDMPSDAAAAREAGTGSVLVDAAETPWRTVRRRLFEGRAPLV
ncbi:HAD-IIIA family hydrolase [Flexivirga caeni]|uniref:D,D-heptose 1,7-bisphosphate phosphatase n=1 Tax=Flexivirga caeni TaxID=2294115 RepID=A0A3M9MHH9_9MICO|nr:HAD-IIIA family hydrolase [Flexivirga caeni]RNI24607.1 HAD-IIIA family hydrolase [Flexivirga caeni]